MPSPRERWIIRLAPIAVGKTGLTMMMRRTVAPGHHVRPDGSLINPARALTEQQRRELGLRRNGQPRVRRPARTPGAAA